MRWDGQGNPVAAQTTLCGRPVAVSVLAGEIMLEITRLKNLLICGEDKLLGKVGKSFERLSWNRRVFEHAVEKAGAVWGLKSSKYDYSCFF